MKRRASARDGAVLVGGARGKTGASGRIATLGKLYFRCDGRCVGLVHRLIVLFIG